MEIIICDEDIQFLDKVAQCCKSVCGDDDGITVYSDSRQLLKYLFTEHPQVDLLILDIEMPELDGLELKRQIASIYMNTNILFLTNHREMMEDAFGRNVIGFLLKEHFEERLSRYVYEIREDLHKEDRIEVCINGEMKYFFKSRIVKFKSQHIYSVMTIEQFYNRNKHTLETKEEIYRISLGKWMDILQDDTFYRVGRTFIVNFKYIRKITDNIVLKTGEELTIPVRKRAEVKNAYNEYCLRRTGILY